MAKSIKRIKELRLKHFRAFEDARLPLDDFTVLVGRNGSGKTSLIEAFEFMRFAVGNSLPRAVDRAGGMHELKQRQATPGKPFDLSIALVIELDHVEFLYGFKIGPKKDSENQWIVKEERLESDEYDGFRRTENSFKSEVSDLSPPVERDTLVLPMVAGTNKIWTSLWRVIRSVQSYNLSPEAIRSEPPVGSANILEKDGRNTGDLLQVVLSDPEARDFLLSHLKAITPGFVNVSADAHAGRRVLKFQQQGRTDNEVFEFTGRSMSDGTVRALSILVALLKKPGPPLIIADEIDDSLHPHAVDVLIDALTSKLDQTQIMISTHDIEVLSSPQVTGNRVRIVDWANGVSNVYMPTRKVIDQIGPLETTIGELLRTNALFKDHLPLTNKKSFWSLS